jgi:hypothetical protein
MRTSRMRLAVRVPYGNETLYTKLVEKCGRKKYAMTTLNT